MPAVVCSAAAHDASTGVQADQEPTFRTETPCFPARGRLLSKTARVLYTKQQSHAHWFVMTAQANSFHLACFGIEQHYKP